MAYDGCINCLFLRRNEWALSFDCTFYNFWGIFLSLTFDFKSKLLMQEASAISASQIKYIFRIEPKTKNVNRVSSVESTTKNMNGNQ